MDKRPGSSCCMCPAQQLAGIAAHPYQPYHQHVEHDQALPKIFMGNTERGFIPLPQIKQADHPDHVQTLHSEKSQRQAPCPMPPARRESDDGGKQNDAGFDAVAARFYRYPEAGRRIPQYLAERGGIDIKKRHQSDTGFCQECRPGQHQVLLHRLQEFNTKQQQLQRQKDPKEVIPFQEDKESDKKVLSKF